LKVPAGNAGGIRAALLGLDLDEIRPELRRLGITLTVSSPQVVISHGGDGTLVGAERRYPGVPKVPIRLFSNYLLCKRHRPRAILERLAKGVLREERFIKTSVQHGDRRKTALNEAGIHMVNPASAVRFRLFVNGAAYVEGEIIGDGLIVATPFGSTAYFRSITRGTFRDGLGLAIVNSVVPIEWTVLRETDVIEAEITRGPAVVIADNDPKQWRLSRGSVVKFGVADERASILGYDALTCPDCQTNRRGRDRKR